MNALGFELDQPEPEPEDDEDEGWIDDDEWNEEQGCARGVPLTRKNALIFVTSPRCAALHGKRFT